jgi:hypothetical protein
VFGFSGCLDEPEIEDRWTRLDVVSSSLAPGQSVAPGSTLQVSARTSITYRRILTGFAVTELRASGAFSLNDVTLHPEAARVAMAQHIDSILANSVSLGRATRAVTGWDHLVQELDVGFSGTVPAAADSAGNPVGLFLISYLGSGVEVEQPDGSDSLVVTPFPSVPYEILPVGIELVISSGGP